MPLVYACIAPHGSEAIQKLAAKTTVKKFARTRNGLVTLAAEVGRARPDTVVLATPHNLKLWGRICIVTAEHSTGTLPASPRNKASVKLKANCDVRLARKIVSEAITRGLPVVGANYGTAEGKLSDMPMDWGTLVPLWFIMQSCRKKPKLVIVSPSREIPLTMNFRFGQLIAEQVESDRRKRVVFVASSDQAHTHKSSGPYGFSHRANDYDDKILQAISRNNLAAIMKINHDLVEAAKPDSLWQMAILAGILDRVELTSELISYDIPTYFGMICASFRREQAS